MPDAGEQKTSCGSFTALEGQADLVPDLEKAVSDLSEKVAAWKRLAGEAERQLDVLRGGVR